VLRAVEIQKWSQSASKLKFCRSSRLSNRLSAGPPLAPHPTADPPMSNHPSAAPLVPHPPQLEAAPPPQLEPAPRVGPGRPILFGVPLTVAQRSKRSREKRKGREWTPADTPKRKPLPSTERSRKSRAKKAPRRPSRGATSFGVPLTVAQRSAKSRAEKKSLVWTWTPADTPKPKP
jgi:hypothetical protein